MFSLPNTYLSYDIYQSFIDKDHFLARLKHLFPWEEMSDPLGDLAHNNEGGKPRWSPVILLKMLFISFLFDHSDRDTEEAAASNLYVKYFLGLAINERAPDYSTLCRFRGEVLLTKGTSFFDTLFRQIIGTAKKRGVSFSPIKALDATHTLASVDTARPQDSTTPQDPNASWGCKGTETKITKGGTKVEVQKLFFGYKAHLLGETNHGLVSGFHVTPGNVADIDGGDVLIHRTLTDEERKDTHFLLGDKGYGCAVWINLLEKYTGIHTAFSLPKSMLTKGVYQKKWQDYVADPNRNELKKERYIIERINADMKENHGLRRCRYRGIIKYHFQTAMAAMAHNLKLTITLLTGARLRPL